MLRWLSLGVALVAFLCGGTSAGEKKGTKRFPATITKFTTDNKVVISFTKEKGEKPKVASLSVENISFQKDDKKISYAEMKTLFGEKGKIAVIVNIIDNGGPIEDNKLELTVGKPKRKVP